MIVSVPKNKKEFLIIIDYSLSDILADLSQLLSNLTNYEGIEDDDVLLDIALTISRSYGSLSTASIA